MGVPGRGGRSRSGCGRNYCRAANGRLLTTSQPPFPEGFKLPLFSPKAPSVEATPYLQTHPTVLVLLSLDLGVLSFRVYLRWATRSLHLLVCSLGDAGRRSEHEQVSGVSGGAYGSSWCVLGIRRGRAV